MMEFKELPGQMYTRLTMELNRNVLKNCKLWSTLPWVRNLRGLSQSPLHSQSSHPVFTRLSQCSCRVTAVCGCAWQTAVIALMRELRPVVFPPHHNVVLEGRPSGGLHFIEQALTLPPPHPQPVPALHEQAVVTHLASLKLSFWC